jgi:alcohol dehydrogenase class IV
MKGFRFHQPTEIMFGPGRVADVGRIVARLGRRCLIVSGSVERSVPILDRVKASLAAEDVAWAHFAGVVPNPTTDIVSAGARAARDHGADVVLGVGGGSSMDTAKAVAVEAAHPGSCWDYLFFRPAQPTASTLPIAAVTTTSGSASHVSQVAVVTHPGERVKSALYHERLFPKASIVDPELMLSAPPRLTAITGFDVFAHAFECFIAPAGSPLTDLLAFEALRTTAGVLPGLIADGSDLSARSRMAWADTLAGLAIANACVTLPHGIAMAVGGLYPHIAHGEALAAVYPAVLRYSWSAAPAKFAAVGRLFDASTPQAEDDAAAEKACDAIESFLDALGLRFGLKDFGIPRSGLDELARASLVLPDYKNHPRLADLDAVGAILRASYGS